MEYERIILPYNSLEAVIDDKTLGLHYNGHYKNYTDKLNKLLKENNYDYRYSPEELAMNINLFPFKNNSDLLFNLGGYLNHSLYFDHLTDNKVLIPEGLEKEINKYFGSFNNFKKEFINMVLELKGSGWTYLVLDKNNKLRIINLPNQDSPYYYGFIPIMGIDMWEHAYYIKYNLDKKKYLENIFNIIDFNKAYRNLLNAKR